MAIAQRVLLADFALANPLYANARVWVYAAAVNTGTATTSLATLYRAPTGTDEEANPFTLDSQGKLQRPVYVDVPVVARVTDALVPVHDTGVIGLISRFREEWEAAVIYQVGDIIRDGAAGVNTGYLYICAEAHTAGVWDDDLAAAKWVLYLQGGSGGGGGGSGVEGEFTISLDVGTASANEIRLVGAAAGSDPTISTLGTDAHPNVRVTPKGNGYLWTPRVSIGGTTRPDGANANVFRRLTVNYPVSALSDTSQGGVRVGGNLFGTLTNGSVGIGMLVAADTDTVNAADGFILDYVGHSVSAGAIGGRTGHVTELSINGNANAGSMKYYTARGARTIARASMGGVHNGTLGEVFGGNDLVELHRGSGSFPGAGMNVNQLVAYETNTAAEHGTQALWHHSLQIVQLSNHVTRATTSDAGLIFVNQPTTAGFWGNGIQFGAVNGKWPFHGASSSLIGTFANNSAIVSDAYAAANGIDFSAVSFGRAALMTSGAALDGSDNFGAQTTAGVSLQTRDGVIARTAVVNTIDVLDPGLWGNSVTPTLTIDAPPGSGTQATATVATWVCGRVGQINDGGGSYVAGDILTDTGGTFSTPAAFKIIRIGATGNVTDLMPVAAYVTGSISGATLTVSAASYGNLAVGMRLDGDGVAHGTYIISGSHPTWTVSQSQTVASTVICATTYHNTSGRYTVRSGAATLLSGGTGSGCTVSLAFGIGSVTVAGGGANYPQYPAPKCLSSGSALRPAMLRVNMTASAAGLNIGNNYANFVTLTGATAGNSPTFTAAGSDAAVGFRFTPKGGAQTRFDGPILQQYTNSPTSTLTPFFRANQTVSGTVTTGNPFINDFNAVDNLTATATNGANWMYFGHVYGSSLQGDRASMKLVTDIAARPADSTSGVKYYVGFNGNMTVNADLSNGGGGYNGNVIGLSYDARVGASGEVSLIEACEMGAGVMAGGGAQLVNVLKLSPLGGVGAGGGTLSYNGLAFSSALGDTGLNVGIAFGGREGTGWPIASTGSLIAITDPSGTPAKTVAFGIDFETVACTFSTAAFASPGFRVNGSGTVTSTGQILALRVVTAAGAMTVSATDDVVVVNKTVGAATTVNLPAGVTGRRYTIKDGKGDAAANNITITPAAGNIDGAATLVISTNYGRATVAYNGTQWNQVA
jgi:hypothetical protein